jgi:hypothetical protein
MFKQIYKLAELKEISINDKDFIVIKEKYKEVLS